MSKEIIALAESLHGSHTAALKKFLSGSVPPRGIFKELPNDLQASVDSYLATGCLDDKLDGLFERAASREGKDIRETDLLLLDYARQHQLPVVTIDSSKVQTDKYHRKSEIGYWFLAGESRNEDMFNTIKERLKDGERWFLLGGLAHLKLGQHFRSDDKTLGERLKEWLGEGYQVVVLD